MSVRITIRDRNNIPRLEAQVRKISGRKVRVGIFGGEDSEMKTIGAVHEFGAEIMVTPKMRAWFAAQGYPLKKSTTSIKIPERSFIRSGFDENESALLSKIEESFQSVLDLNINADVFADAVGLELEGMIQDKMTNLREPANSDMTIERKGSDNPLVDSGRLIEAITHKVE